MTVAWRDAVLRKAAESVQTKEAFFAAHADELVRCAQAVASRLQDGGRLLTFGNGGSACDAQHLAVEFVHPAVEKRPALGAICLSNDTALMTAIGNDQDFALSFSDPLKLLARKGDVVAAFSTSGKSRNVIRGLQAAREMGLLTVGFAGRDGGRMGDWCDHFFRVASFSVHRIQETHQTALHLVWDLVHLIRGEEDVL
jgi:D-sedoheptulose 7-phosphate isomerase